MLKLVLLTVLSVIVISIAAKEGCPTVHGIFGCAYMPRCFGDSMCGAGHKCCPHPCGNQCMLVVNCDKLDCNMVCAYGLERDEKGCDVCKCRSTPGCSPTDISCLLGNSHLNNLG